MCRLSDLPQQFAPKSSRASPHRSPGPLPRLRFPSRALLSLLIRTLTATTAHAAPSRNKLDRLLAEYAERQTRFSADMRALAGFCDQNGFPNDAARIRSLAVPIDEQTVDIDRLPEKVQPDIPKGLK